MKKRSFEDASKTSWENYRSNFSDLMLRPESPCKKVRKRQKGEKDCKDDDDDDDLSQDMSINWSSSEDEKEEENNNNLSKGSLIDGKLSPVVGSSSKKANIVNKSLVKSTPSGSPVLAQACFSTVQKKSRRRPSLLPLSPITPGTFDTISFAHLSQLSIYGNNDSTFVQSEPDTTPLAFPLDDSDEELAKIFCDNGGENQGAATQDEIEAVTSQTASSSSAHCEASDASLNLTISEDCATQDDPLSQPAENFPLSSCSGQKGSSWIATLVEKIDESNANASAMDCHGFLQTNCYDSGKKQKFIRGGFADQMQQVLRQEKSSKIVFQHQAKETKTEELRCCLKVRAMSQHKEGGLHILECQVVKKGSQMQIDGSFVTLLLQHEAVVETNINMRSQFVIKPPWKTINLGQHPHPVLLCVNHVSVELNVDVAKKIPLANKIPLSESCSSKSAGSYQGCESILQALENNLNCRNITLAATVQRVYHKLENPNSSSVVTFLCEDAFGIFFEIEVDQSLVCNPLWSRLIEGGEGQRILFRDLELKGRTTQVQSPKLFSLISSVWDSEGNGLLQIQSSQSQSESMETHSQTNLQPPNFCYLLCAMQNISKLPNKCVPIRGKTWASGLNRPTSDGSIDYDVLYFPPCLCESHEQMVAHSSSRVSLLCKAIHYHTPETSLNIGAASLLSVVTAKKEVFCVYLQNTHAIEPQVARQSCVLLRDLYFSSDGKLYFDTYSTVTHVTRDILACGLALNGLPSGTNLNSYCRAVVQVAKSQCSLYECLHQHTAVGSFVSMEGVIRKTTRHSSQTPESRSHMAWLEGEGESKTQFLIEVSTELAATVQLSNYSYWSLLTGGNFQMEKSLEDVIGTKLGPIQCYVFDKKLENDVTVFSAEELS